ncbi:MAG TPA: iron-containing alcohol dehydrogenase, partial [Longimicrobiales bacterium]|nr:iron-containing alcohol dehydrogenase [Longimicrobiales bacterium]
MPPPSGGSEADAGAPPAALVRAGGLPADYPVLVERGLLDRLDAVVARHAPAHRYAVVSDETVAALYGERVTGVLRQTGRAVELVTFPAGEANKTREWWGRVTDRLLEEGLGRDAAVVAVGGGVTGDLAGFVAATYLRGVPVVQVPTSLVAMIDSSVGGKTGVDTAAGKNLVGAFHPPRAVAVDPEATVTLPRAERAQ